jgi:ureidoacrylate peracid hydrolase
VNAPVRDEAASPVKPDGLADWIARGRTAVLVIDMQVDFASPEGALGAAGVDLSAVPAALAAAKRLVEGARAADVPVIFVGLQTEPELDSPAWRERMRRQGGDPDADSGLCRAGQPGAAFVGPTPEPGEWVVAKLRYSGFFGTRLDLDLTTMGVDTLVVCGLTTECCVDSTVRDAFHLDYHVFVAADACAAYEPDLHAAALKSLELNCAIIIDTEGAIAAWAEAS